MILPRPPPSKEAVAHRQRSLAICPSAWNTVSNRSGDSASDTALSNSWPHSVHT